MLTPISIRNEVIAESEWSPSTLSVFLVVLLDQGKSIGWTCWNKMSFKQCLLSFDDNNVLKVQLNMLIFVQVYRIIY